MLRLEETSRTPIHPWMEPVHNWLHVYFDFAGLFQGHYFVVLVGAKSKSLSDVLKPIFEPIKEN